MHLKSIEAILFVMYGICVVMFLLGIVRSYIGTYSLMECLDGFLVWVNLDGVSLGEIETPLKINTFFQAVYCILVIVLICSVVARTKQTLKNYNWKKEDRIYHWAAIDNLLKMCRGFLIMGGFTFFSIIFLGTKLGLPQILFFALLVVNMMAANLLDFANGFGVSNYKMSFRVYAWRLLKLSIYALIFIFIGQTFLKHVPTLTEMFTENMGFFSCALYILALFLYLGSLTCLYDGTASDGFLKFFVIYCVVFLIIALVGTLIGFEGTISTSVLLQTAFEQNKEYGIPLLLLTIAAFLIKYYPSVLPHEKL